MKKIVQFSIKNPLLVNVVFAFVVIGGLISTYRLQREAFPRFSFDLVVVTTPYLGATPVEIEKLITIPIEKELKQVQDIKEITSVSAEGISVISVVIDEDADNKDKTINDIQRAVDRAEDLPADLDEKPLVNDIKTEDRPIFEVGLSGNIPEEDLRAYARALEKKILNIGDVARVERQGFREREIWVEVDPQTMGEMHISLFDIAEALKKQNLALPGGKFYLNGKEHLLRTTGEFDDHTDVQKTIVRASALGKWIPLKDIARVSPALEEETLMQKTQGTRSIHLVVVKKARGDTIKLSEQIKKITQDFQQTADPALEISFVDNMSYFIQRRQNVLINNGIIGMIMVIVSLFTFLSVRTAIAACVGIPTALFLTFILMYFSGISVNLLSMFGLIMVLGMLVDEDIVISENIYRHLEQDKTVADATVAGVCEVIAPLLATVLTTVAAFIPLMLMGGTMGKFVRHIPVVLILTLIASLIVAIVILPSHLHDLNRIKISGKKGSAKKFSHLFQKLTRAYKSLLERVIRFRYATALLLFIILGATLLFARSHMKFILFPSKGIEMFVVKMETKIGDSLETTSKKASAVEKYVAELPSHELKYFTTRVGIISEGPNDPQTKRAPHVGQIRVELTPEAERTRTVHEIMEDLRKKTAPLTGFERLEFDIRRMGPPVGKPVQVRISGDDLKLSKTLAGRFADALEKIPGVTDIKDDYDLNRDEILIKVDAVKAAQTGLSVEQIAAAVRSAFDGLVATSIKTSEEEIDIVVKFPHNVRRDRDALKSLLVPNEQKKLIVLDHVADFQESKGALLIKHHDNIRTVSVTANVNEDVTSPLKVSRKLVPLIAELESQHPEMNIHFGGEVEETQESLQDLFTALYFAGALILIILIAMLRSLMEPVVIMLSIPFSLIGVVFAFFIHDEPFSFMSFLGLVGLTGVVVDAGVIMTDFINRLKAGGMPPRQAIIEGAGVRLRAVVLTSLTTFVGIIPAAYGLGGMDPFIRPMALALNYGILFGSLITVFFVPAFLAIVEDVYAVGRRLMLVVIPAKARIQ